jgi:hypothetical protein
MAYGMHGRDDKIMQRFSRGNQKGRAHLEDPGIDFRAVLKLIF